MHPEWTGAAQPLGKGAVFFLPGSFRLNYAGMELWLWISRSEHDAPSYAPIPSTYHLGSERLISFPIVHTISMNTPCSDPNCFHLSVCWTRGRYAADCNQDMANPRRGRWTICLMLMCVPGHVHQEVGQLQIQKRPPLNNLFYRAKMRSCCSGCITLFVRIF